MDELSYDVSMDIHEDREVSEMFALADRLVPVRGNRSASLVVPKYTSQEEKMNPFKRFEPLPGDNFKLRVVVVLLGSDASSLREVTVTVLRLLIPVPEGAPMTLGHEGRTLPLVQIPPDLPIRRISWRLLISKGEPHGILQLQL